MNKFLFLDIDGCMNSLLSLYKKRAEVAGVEFRKDLFTNPDMKKEFGEHTSKINNIISDMRKNGQFVPSFSMDNYPFSEEAIQHLNEIVDTTGCKVVLSSTWRMTSGLKGTEKKLKENGFKYELHDATPSDLPTSQRGAEIKHWLKENSTEEFKFAIVDDDWQDIYGWFPDNLVVTTFRLGLTHKEKDQILSLLL